MFGVNTYAQEFLSRSDADVKKT